MFSTLFSGRKAGGMAIASRLLTTLVAGAALNPALAQTTSTAWQGGDRVYLLDTTGSGQVVNFGTPPRPRVDEAQKAYFQPAPNATRIFSATVTASVPALGTVNATLAGDTCLRIASTNASNYGGANNPALSVNVLLVDKIYRNPAAAPKIARVVRSFQGGQNSGESCDSPTPPVANPDTLAAVPQNSAGVDVTTVLANDTGTALRLTDVQIFNANGPAANVGRIENITATGFRFVPNPAFSGDAIVAYAISDGRYRAPNWAPRATDTFTMESRVRIPVTAVAHPPSASNITVTGEFNTPLTFSITPYVADADGNTVRLTSVSTPSVGSVQWTAGGTQIVYTPAVDTFGNANFTYTVNDGTATAPQTANIVVQVKNAEDSNQQPAVTAPTARQVITVNDTDNAGGELVTINGAAEDPDFDEVLWQWVVDGATSNTTGPVFSQRLANGTHAISAQVRDEDLLSQRVEFTVVVNAAGANRGPTLTLAASGGTTNIIDTNNLAGESVGFTASAADPDGTINATSYRWTINGNAVASANGQAGITAGLPDGESTVTVTVADNAGVTSTASIAVTVSSPFPSLASIARNPVQAAVGRALDTLCPMLGEDAEGLSADAQDLLAQCNRILGNFANPDQQRDALQALAGEELKAAQSMTIDFGKTQASNISGRLQALRSGARGVSLAGLNVSYDGSSLPLDVIGDAARAFGLKSCASDPAGLADQRWGFFANGKVGFGDKDTTDYDTGFDYDSIGATVGVDYRFTDSLVAGFALGYSNAEADFVQSQGNLESKGLSGTLFGSWYKGPAYLDVIAGYGKVDYDSLRHISYLVGTDVVDREATGSTNGGLTTAGASFGYELGLKGWSITPIASVTYMKVDVDGFTETGAAGLDLEYGDQSADSLQYQAGAQVSYRVSRSWGVITPQLYGSFVVDKQDLGGIFLRFANDPFSASPNQPGSQTAFFVPGDAPDENYVRWGGSLSAVFKNLVSAFVSYDSYAGMDTIRYSEVTVGVRLQTSF